MIFVEVERSPFEANKDLVAESDKAPNHTGSINPLNCPLRFFSNWFKTHCELACSKQSNGLTKVKVVKWCQKG